MKTSARCLRIGLLALIAAGLLPPLASRAASSAPSNPERAREPLRLGTVTFPATGVAAAQPDFLHGVAALHSFWYEEALEAFGRAAKIDPAFAMAHWGEAMCYHRSFRPGSDYKAGRQALTKIKNTSGLTRRERDYIDAARTLFGGGESPKGDEYADAMARIHGAYPDDSEATAFYALALLGSSNKEKKAMAGKLAEEVYRLNPNHPGAAHYIIHAYDDPATASRALAAAHQYSKIAPDAPHALHMPSHIFVQLGMWQEAATSNDLGWAASVDYVSRKQLAPAMRDYHNLHWLIYALLQKGRYARAEALVDEFVRMRERRELASYSGRYIDGALAAYLVETRRWDRADALFTPGAGSTATAGSAGKVELCGAAPAEAPKVEKKKSTTGDTPTFMRAFAAAVNGVSPSGKFSKIRELQLTGLVKAHRRDFSGALKTLREAADLEGEKPRPPGPSVDKPAHELLGEVLLAAGQPTDAVKQFKIALDRHPNRALSLIGRARAEAAAGDRTAARSSYQKFLEIWQQADTDRPELGEAREFLKATG